MMDQKHPAAAGVSSPISPWRKIPSLIPKAAVIVLLLFSAGYAWFLASHGVSYASASDASGYFNSARLLDEGRATDAVRTIKGLTPPEWNYYFQQPLGFSATGDNPVMRPTYPIGLPLMLLGASKLVGWGHAAILVNVICALGCGWLTVRFGQRFCGLNAAWALLAASLLWLCPLFVFFSLQPMSDMPATFWVLLMFYATAAARERPRWAIIAGMAAGMAVLVRPTNALLAIPAIVLLGFTWRAWLAFIVAGLPFAAALGYYNHLLYGSALASGYGDVSALFQTVFAKHNVVHFSHWIPRLLTPLAVLALGLPWLLRSHPRIVLALGLWSAGLIGFYAYYYHSGETWWYLRFILPAFPCLILLALMTLQRATDRWSSPTAQTLLAIVLVGLTAWQQTKLSRSLYITDIKRTETAYINTIHWLQSHVPANTVTVAMQASGALHFYTEYPLLRYDLAPPELFARAVEAAHTNGQEIYAPLFPFEIPRVVDVHLGGTWEKVATIEHVTIWRLQP